MKSFFFFFFSSFFKKKLYLSISNRECRRLLERLEILNSNEQLMDRRNSEIIQENKQPEFQEFPDDDEYDFSFSERNLGGQHLIRQKIYSIGL